jgi:hypothetical protein
MKTTTTSAIAIAAAAIILLLMLLLIQVLLHLVSGLAQGYGWNCWHWVALIKRGFVQHCMVSRFITLEVPKHIHRIRKPGHRPTKFAGTSLANHAASHAYPLVLTPVCLQSARWLRHS